MATYGIADTAYAHYRESEAYVASVIVDFSSTTNAANDVFQCLKVPANTIVLNAGIDVLTADTAGNSGTVALGDGTNDYVAAVAPTSTGPLAPSTIAAISTDMSADANDNELKGKVNAILGVLYKGDMNVFVNANDTIDLTVGTGAINAVVRVWAVMADVAAKRNSTQTVTFSTAGAV